MTAADLWFAIASDPTTSIGRSIAQAGGRVWRDDHGQVYEQYDRDVVLARYAAKAQETASYFPEIYHSRALDQFAIEPYAKQNAEIAAKALRVAQNYIENYRRILDEHGSNGLYFYSRTRGSGKTMLATIVGAEMSRKGVKVRFYSMPGLLDEIKATFDKDSGTSTAAVINAAMRAELLILDDIGVEKQTSWVNETLYKIINERMTHGRPTVFTSNLRVDELAYDERIKDRIGRIAFPVALPEESVRKKLAQIDNAELAGILEG